MADEAARSRKDYVVYALYASTALKDTSMHEFEGELKTIIIKHYCELCCVVLLAACMHVLIINYTNFLRQPLFMTQAWPSRACKDSFHNAQPYIKGINNRKKKDMIGG